MKFTLPELPKDLQPIELDKNNLTKKYSLPNLEEPPVSTPVEHNQLPESKFDIDVPLGGDFQELRGERQPGIEEIGAGVVNSASELVFGTLKNASYLLDFPQYVDVLNGSERDFSNFFADATQKLQDKLEIPIYRTKADEGFSPLHAGWWGSNMPSMVSTISMAIPATMAVKGMGAAAKLMGGTKLMKAIGMGVGEAKTLEGITGAIYSRQMESIAEGAQTFQETYNEALKDLQQKYPELPQDQLDEKAKQIASEAAVQNYKLNWVALAQDLPEYMLMFGAFGNSKKLAKLFSSEAKNVIGVGVSEGIEEGYQFITDKEARRNAMIKAGLTPDDNSNILERSLNYAKDGDFWTSAFFGALGGIGFVAIMNNKIKAQEKARNEMYNNLLDQHKNLLNTNPDEFVKVQDNVFFSVAMKHFQSGTLDLLRSDLEKLKKSSKEFLDSSPTLDSKDFQSKISDRLADLDYIEETASNINNKLDVSPKLKVYELATKLSQHLVEKAAAKVNQEVEQEVASDSVLRGLSIKQAILKKEIIQLAALTSIGDKHSEAKIKRLQNSIDQAENEIIADDFTYPELKTIDDVRNSLKTSIDETLIKKIFTAAQYDKELNSIRESLSKLGTQKGKDELEKEIVEQAEKNAKLAEEVRKKAEEEEKKKTEKVLPIVTPVDKTIQQVTTKGFLSDTGVPELKVVAQENLPDGSVVYTLEDGNTVNSTDGWIETNKTDKNAEDIEILNSPDHFTDIHKYSIDRERSKLQEMNKKTGEPIESILARLGKKAFPAHFAQAAMSKVLATIPQSEHSKYIKLVGKLVTPTIHSKVVPLGVQTKLRGKRKEGAHIILEVTDPETKEVFSLAHGYNPDFYEELDDDNNWKSVVFTDMPYERFVQLFKFRREEVTPEAYKKFQESWARAHEFNRLALIYVQQNGDKVALPSNTFIINAKGTLEFIGKDEPISANKFEEFKDRSVIFKSAGKVQFVNDITPETDPSNLEDGSYYVEAKFKNGKTRWIKLFPDTAKLDSKEAQESINHINSLISALREIPENASLEELKPRFNEMLRSIDFYVQSNNSKLGVTFKISKAANEEQYTLKTVLKLDLDRGQDNPNQELPLRGTFKDMTAFKNHIGSLYVKSGDNKVIVGTVTIRKNLPFDTETTKIKDPLKQLASSTTKNIISNWNGSFIFFPENFKLENQPQQPKPVAAKSAIKEDFGDDFNPNEVDEFFNPQTIDSVAQEVSPKVADIEGRRQEELKSRVVYDRFPTVEDGEFKIIGDPNNRTYRINENTGRPQELDESNGLWSNTALAPNLFMESTKRSGFEKSKSKINAKYDAELASLESKSSEFTPEQEKIYKNLLSQGFSEESSRKLALETGSDLESDKVTTDVDTTNAFTLKQATDFIQSKFGDAFTVQDINMLVSNSIINGTRVGTVLGKTLYLANGVSRTYTFHEAFHAVFNNLLSRQKQRIYTNKIKAELNLSTSQLKTKIEALRNTSTQYSMLSDSEMEQRVYEEALADKYADWQDAKESQIKGFWKTLFNKIRNFINTLVGNPSIIHLFNQIDSGAFKNSGFKDTRTGEYEKIIPKTPAHESKQIINTIVGGVLANSFTTSDTGSRIVNSFNSFASKFDLSIPENIEFAKTLADVNGALLTMKKFHNKLVQNKDLIVSEATKVLNQIGYREDQKDFDEFSDDDSERNFDIISSEYDPSTRIGAHIKQLLATTLYNDFDIFGRPTKVAVAWREVYNRMLPTLSVASTHPEELLGKLAAMAKYNPQIHAFYTRIVQLSGYDKTHAPNGVGTNGENLITQLKKAFELNKVLYLQAVDQGSKYDLFIENKRDLSVAKEQLWNSNYQKFYKKVLEEVKLGKSPLLSLVQNDFVMLERYLKGETNIQTDWKYKNYSLEDKVFYVFSNIGITLERPYLEYSFGTSEEDIKNREILQSSGIKIITSDDLQYIRQNLDKNLFKVQSELLNKISEADANFDTYAFQKTYTDAKGKKRYSYGLDSLLGLQTRTLKETFKDAESVKKFIDANKAYWELNPLMSKDPALIVRLIKNFDTGLAYDLKVGDNGSTSKDINLYDALMYMHALFQGQQSKAYDGITSAPVVLNQFADKSQQMWGILPVFKYYDSKTKQLTEQGKTDLWNLFVQEFNRTEGKYGTHFLSYKKGKQFIHFQTFNDTSNREAQDILLGARTDLNSVKDRVLALIKTDIDHEVSDHLALLQENKFTGKINPDMIKLYGDLSGYLYNFTLNNLLMTVGINQLISGDYGSAKNWEDYVKRISMINNAGYSYGKNQDANDMHRVLYVQDSFIYIDPVTKEKSLTPREGYEKINTDDAQVYSSLTSHEDDLKRQGRYNDKIGEVINKLKGNVIEDGKPVWPTLKEIKDAGVGLIPSKQVTAGFNSEGQTVYHKMAVCYLTPQLVADYKDGKWVPKVGKEELFKKMMLLETPDAEGNIITHIVPNSASKLFFPDNAVDLSKDDKITPDQIYKVPNIYRRLVLENDSKESGKVTSSNQVENIIGSEVKSEEGLKLLEENNRLNSVLRSQTFDFVRNILVKNNDRAQADVLLAKFRAIIEESTPDNQMLEMLEEEAGKMKYDSNMPHLHSKFTSLFLSTFKEVFRQKVPGVKFTAMSSQGYNIIDKETNKPRPLHGMRHVNGVTIPAEVVVSKKWADERGFKVGDEIILFRVPSQSYHSTAVAKVVELLPEAYGDTIIAPADFVWLMGMDFDVDALYSYKKSYFKNREGKVIEYGKENSIEDKFDGYIKDLFKNNSYFKTYFTEALKNNPDYRRLNPTPIDDLMEDEDQLYFKKILISPDFKENEDSRIYQEVLIQSLQRFNLPTTPETLVQSGLEANNSLTNKLFDTKYKILSLPELQDAFSQALAQKEDENVKLGRENDITPIRVNGSPLSVLAARQAAVQSKGLVGTAVNGNSFIQFVTPLNTPVNPRYALSFNGITYNTFENIDLKQTRLKFDRASMTLGSILDGMKKPFAKYLNYDFNTVNKVMMMYGLNIPEDVIDAFFIQPVLKNITTELNKTQRLTLPLHQYMSRDDKADVIFKTELNKVLKNIPKEDQKTIGKDISKAELLAALKANQQKIYTKEYYTTQYKVLKAYESLSIMDAARAHVNKILSTNRALGSESTDFYNVLNAVQSLEEEKIQTFPGLIGKIQGNPVLSSNIRSVSGAIEALKHYDISETDAAKKIFEAFKSIFKGKINNKDLVEIKRVIIASLQSAVLRNSEDTNQFRSLLLTGENSLASKLRDFLVENPKNFFLRQLDFIDSKKNGYTLVTMDSRTKFSETVQDDLLNSGARIAEKNPQLYKDMFNYLVFKDALLFRNGSFIKYMVPEMFLPMAKASQQINRILAQDTIDSEAFKALTGVTLREFADQTIENYVRHSINFQKTKNFKQDDFQGLTYNPKTYTFKIEKKDESQSKFIDNDKLRMPLWIKVENVLMKKVSETEDTAVYTPKTPYGSSERFPYPLTPAQNEAFERAQKEAKIDSKLDITNIQEISDEMWAKEIEEFDNYSSPKEVTEGVNDAVNDAVKEEIKPKSKISNIADDFIPESTDLNAFNSLMEEDIRESVMTLRDNKIYSYDEINSRMLEDMGYSIEEIGKILKRIC